MGTVRPAPTRSPRPRRGITRGQPQGFGFRTGVRSAKVVLGIAWGLWHLPSVVLLPLMTGAANLLQAAFSLVGLTIGIVGYTIVLTWLYNNTGSLFWIVILHGYANDEPGRNYASARATS